MTPYLSVTAIDRTKQEPFFCPSMQDISQKRQTSQRRTRRERVGRKNHTIFGGTVQPGHGVSAEEKGSKRGS